MLLETSVGTGMHVRECATQSAIEGIVSKQYRVVARIGRLACSACDLGLVVVNASKLGAIAVEAVDRTITVSK